MTSTQLESGEQIEEQQGAVEKTTGGRSSLTASRLVTAVDEPDQNAFDEECSERGHLAWRVYTTYCRAVGYTLVLVIVLSVVLMQVTRNTTDLWMAYWVTHMPPNVTQHYYLEPYVYTGRYPLQ